MIWGINVAMGQERIQGVAHPHDYFSDHGTHGYHINGKHRHTTGVVSHLHGSHTHSHEIKLIVDENGDGYNDGFSEADWHDPVEPNWHHSVTVGRVTKTGIKHQHDGYRGPHSHEITENIGLKGEVTQTYDSGLQHFLLHGGHASNYEFKDKDSQGPLRSSTAPPEETELVPIRSSTAPPENPNLPGTVPSDPTTPADLTTPADPTTPAGRHTDNPINTGGTQTEPVAGQGQQSVYNNPGTPNPPETPNPNEATMPPQNTSVPIEVVEYMVRDWSLHRGAVYRSGLNYTTRILIQ